MQKIYRGIVKNERVKVRKTEKETDSNRDEKTEAFGQAEYERKGSRKRQSG